MNKTTQKRLLVAFICALLATIAVLLAIRLQSTEPSSTVSQTTTDRRQEEAGVAPFFFSTMTHMEGSWKEAASNLAFFKKQAGYLRTAMDYAQRYDAVLTFESEIPFAEGMLRFDDNVFQEALDRGMGIGSHCDISPKTKFTDSEIVQEFEKRKQAVDALVDPLENIGCSGGGGLSDWYTGAVGAGFRYMDGTVGYHYLAMPLSMRPDGWTNKAILETYYHEAAPVEEEKLFYPFRVSSASFEEDEEGELVVSGGNVGNLEALSEGRNCGENCTLTQEDVDILVGEIRDFAAERDTTRVAKMEIYIPSKTFNEPQMDYFFQELQKLQDEGIMKWASQKEVYEAFVDWES